MPSTSWISAKRGLAFNWGLHTMQAEWCKQSNTYAELYKTSVRLRPWLLNRLLLAGDDSRDLWPVLQKSARESERGHNCISSSTCCHSLKGKVIMLMGETPINLRWITKIGNGMVTKSSPIHGWGGFTWPLTASIKMVM